MNATFPIKKVHETRDGSPHRCARRSSRVVDIAQDADLGGSTDLAQVRLASGGWGPVFRCGVAEFEAYQRGSKAAACHI